MFVGPVLPDVSCVRRERTRTAASAPASASASPSLGARSVLSRCSTDFALLPSSLRTLRHGLTPKPVLLGSSLATIRAWKARRTLQSLKLTALEGKSKRVDAALANKASSSPRSSSPVVLSTIPNLCHVSLDHRHVRHTTLDPIPSTTSTICSSRRLENPSRLMT